MYRREFLTKKGWTAYPTRIWERTKDGWVSRERIWRNTQDVTYSNGVRVRKHLSGAEVAKDLKSALKDYTKKYGEPISITWIWADEPLTKVHDRIFGVDEDGTRG